jgi:hypothetical protein
LGSEDRAAFAARVDHRLKAAVKPRADCITLLGRMKKQLAAVVLSALVFACSSSEKEKAKERDASSSEPAASASAALPAKDPSKFESADDLIDGVPADAQVCAGLPGMSDLKSVAGATLTPEMLDTAMSSVASNLGLPAADLKKAVEGFDGALIFGRHAGGKVTAGALVHFAKLDVLPPLLEAAKFKKTGSRYAFDEGETHLVVEMVESRGVAIVAQEAAFLDEIKETLKGSKPSFVKNALWEKHDKKSIWVIGDLAALVPQQPDYLAAGSRVLVNAGLDGKNTKVELRQLGTKATRLGSVLAANDHAFAGRLPPGVNSALVMSTKRAAGKTVRDVLAEFSRAADTDVVAKLEELLKPAGVTVDDVERMLGDEIAAGLVLGKGVALGAELMKNAAFVALVETRDEAAAGRLIDFIAKRTGPGSQPGKLKADLGDGMVARVEISKGATVIAIGAPALVNQAIDDVVAGKQGLASSPAFERARQRVSASNMSLIIDPELVKQISALAQQPMPATTDLDFDLFFLDNPAGLDMRITGNGSVAVIGAASAMGIYGVRRYLQRAREAQGRATP